MHKSTITLISLLSLAQLSMATEADTTVTVTVNSCTSAGSLPTSTAITPKDSTDILAGGVVPPLVSGVPAVGSKEDSDIPLGTGYDSLPYGDSYSGSSTTQGVYPTSTLVSYGADSTETVSPNIVNGADETKYSLLALSAILFNFFIAL